VTPYDACYAALADLLDAPFVTADRKLASTLSSRGAAVVFLGDIA
jgi:predicted nucleic acid-binding protein